MKISIHADRELLGRAAAGQAAEALLETCRLKGTAMLVVATGSSQFEVLAALAAIPTLPWAAITVFHLDEYVGLSASHPASFRRYLRERFVERLPARPAAFHEIDGTADFETREPDLVVSIDEACRRQQVGEGWFSSLAAVPTRAISIGNRRRCSAGRQRWPMASLQGVTVAHDHQPSIPRHHRRFALIDQHPGLLGSLSSGVRPGRDHAWHTTDRRRRG